MNFLKTLFMGCLKTWGISASVPVPSGYKTKMKPSMLFKPSPNYHHGRTYPITTIVLHATATPAIASPLAWLCEKASGVSAHYLIDRDGSCFQLVNDMDVAWHAGESEWQNRPQVNTFSIGIEMVNSNDGKQEYPEAQLTTCAQLCAAIMQEHGIIISNVVSHAEIATPAGRKTDPYAFPWDRFRAKVMVL